MAKEVVLVPASDAALGVERGISMLENANAACVWLTYKQGTQDNGDWPAIPPRFVLQLPYDHTSNSKEPVKRLFDVLRDQHHTTNVVDATAPSSEPLDNGNRSGYGFLFRATSEEFYVTADPHHNPEDYANYREAHLAVLGLTGYMKSLSAYVSRIDVLFTPEPSAAIYGAHIDARGEAQTVESLIAKGATQCGQTGYDIENLDGLAACFYFAPPGGSTAA